MWFNADLNCANHKGKYLRLKLLQKDCIVYTLYIRLFTLYYSFLLKRYAQGIFTAGRTDMATQQKKPAPTNTMHLQSTHPPNLQHL